MIETRFWLMGEVEEGNEAAIVQAHEEITKAASEGFWFCGPLPAPYGVLLVFQRETDERRHDETDIAALALRTWGYSIIKITPVSRLTDYLSKFQPVIRELIKQRSKHAPGFYAVRPPDSDGDRSSRPYWVGPVSSDFSEEKATLGLYNLLVQGLDTDPET